MSIDALVELVQVGGLEKWNERNQDALGQLFGAPGGRYGKSAESAIQLRAPGMALDQGVPYAAYIHPNNPGSGAYGGLSFVVFPVADGPCLVGLVTGTQGLSPDEGILGRPGHSRKVNAIAAWLNRRFGSGKLVAWAKQDPTRTDIRVPDYVQREWSGFKSIFDRYGHVMYALYRPNQDRESTALAIKAFLDLMFEERGFEPLASAKPEAESIRREWLRELMPPLEQHEVSQLLEERRYVILQGPPGTGKTRMALELMQSHYGGFGKTIQFHPNTSYENFIGGLAPVNSASELGLQFAPTAGALHEAAALARSDPNRNYLLHIDEINRADLSKILGEAIFLLEATSDIAREIELAYDFGAPYHRNLSLPKNLHVLGTMNTADRSIAIMDVAVRRRFAFASLWPSMEVVENLGCKSMQSAYERLFSLFVEHASPDVFPLIPGHSYFLEKDEAKAHRSLQVNLVPLLEEYLSQGYVSGFAEQIRGYLQWLRVPQDS